MLLLGESQRVRGLLANDEVITTLTAGDERCLIQGYTSHSIILRQFTIIREITFTVMLHKLIGLKLRMFLVALVWELGQVGPPLLPTGCFLLR